MNKTKSILQSSTSLSADGTRIHQQRQAFFVVYNLQKVTISFKTFVSNNKLLFLTFLIIAFAACSKKTSTTPVEAIIYGTNFFNFTYAGLPQKPIKVFYHIPQGDKTNMPILLIFHGDERNAEDYRNWCIAYANQYHFMVFAPEFTVQNFPGASGYSIGNVYTDGNNPTPLTLIPQNQWTFSYIEPLFDSIKAATGSIRNTYKIFGHSGGGQFVHRFVLFKTTARYDTAIAANSGWYTVANPTIAYPNYPYGVSNSPLATVNPTNYFTRKMIVSIGQLDNNANDPSLRHNAFADAQGLNRLDRANYFFQKSQAYATSANTTFNWKFNIVPNSGHDAQLMMDAAVKLLFQ
jgi:hypothetical protein